MKNINRLLFLLIITTSFLFESCKKLVEIDSPRTQLVSASVFENDKTAEAVLLNLYSQLNRKNFSNGATLSFSFACGILADEVNNRYSGFLRDDLRQFDNNDVTSTNKLVETYWNEHYSNIYIANSILEGLKSSQGVSDTLRSQLIGEALFIRAFNYFFLVNLFNNIPLVLSSDYNVNKKIGVSEYSAVYKQIIDDLKKADSLLPADYSRYGDLRIRANKGVAIALLSRAYLYLNDWSNAEICATSLINNPLYALEDSLGGVFKISSKEAIFQLWRTSDDIPKEINTYFNGEIEVRSDLLNSFEPNDNRFLIWIFNNGSINIPDKYKSIFPSQDYSAVFRLAEQYLIRAEARAKLNNISDAIADLNRIRHRAGLGDIIVADLDDLLLAVEQERRVELFTEWGHRWFDLKRTGRSSLILSAIKGNWSDHKLLFPIPQIQIDRDPNMVNAQNPGY